MKLEYLKITFLVTFFLTITLSSQNTIGVLLNTEDALNGYTLFTVHNETYLINNCGEVVNQWTSNYASGKSVYLLENGNLLRAAEIPNPNITIPGIGGRVELFDWDGNLIWEYNYSTNMLSQHHEIFPMPNGNVMILAVTILSDTEAVQMGRDPSNLPNSQLYNQQIIELQPIGTNDANIVWEWNIKDHLIQDFDDTKDNYGNVGENPQRLDINFLGMSNGGANWMHINSVQYNADLDQLILSSRHLHEIYIIDHSTTTAEAATSSGGTYQKGGDFLYRWGNPIAYRQGFTADQKLFGQHYPHWIGEGLIDEGKIIIYNNGITRSPSYSEVDILTPPTTAPGVYSYTDNTAYGPLDPYYIYTAPVRTDFYSPFLSSAQRLPNGNILICEGKKGHFFEINANEDIVWRYVNPVAASGAMTQGDGPEGSGNIVFRAKKYVREYPAFNGKDLIPNSPIENNPDLSQCTILSIADNDFDEILLYPNPVSDVLRINTSYQIEKVEVYDVQGRKLISNELSQDIKFTSVNSGIYLLKIYTSKGMITKKIFKI